MGRINRIWYPGATYHVMCRGNRRGDIFREEEDYVTYLRIVSIAKRRYPFFLYDYCLMTNHVHLQLQTLDHEIWFIMQYINTVYSRYYNKKYNVIGHLFQGRYRAELNEDDSYTVQTSRYIHLNPVKAKMVRLPQEYPWSSYRCYLGLEQSEIVDEAFILDYFKVNPRKAYKDFVEGNHQGAEVPFLEDEVAEWQS